MEGHPPEPSLHKKIRRLRRSLRLLVGETVLLCLLLPVAGAAGQAPVVDDTPGGTNISGRLHYLEEPARGLTIRDVTGQNVLWTPNNSNYVNFGYTPSAYWFRADLVNPAKYDRRVLLEIDFPTLDHVDLFLPNGRGGYNAVRTGDRLPFTTRMVNDPNYVFPLTLFPGRNTVYFRVMNEGSLRFHAYIYSERSFLERKSISLPSLWVLYGMMLLLGLFYLFLFILLRNRLYLYFSLFASILFLYQVSHRGFAFQFLWPRSPWWANTSLPVLMNLLGISCLLFLRTALDTRNTNRFIDRLLLAFSHIGFPVAAVLSMLLPARVILPATYYLLLAAAVLIVSMTLYYFSKGNRFARFLLAGIAIIGVFTITGSLTALGKLPSNIYTEWNLELGFLWLVLIASVGMIHRIKTLTDELRESHLSLQKNNDLLVRANQEMAATNEELNAAMEELEAANEEFEAQNEELIRSEEDLRKSEEKYRTLVENINEVVYSIDATGTIIYMSPGIEKLAGFSCEEMLKKNYTGFIHPDDLGFLIEDFNELSRGIVKPSEYRITTKSGGYRWVMTMSKPFFRDGAFAGAGGVLTDIHDRRLAEEAISRSEEKYRGLVENINDVVYSADAAGTITYISPAITKIIGISPDKITGRPFIDIVYHDDREFLASRFTRVMKGINEPTEYRLAMRSGGFRWVSSNSRPLFTDGVFRGASGIITDIHERKIAEEELRETLENLKKSQRIGRVGNWLFDVTKSVFTASEEEKLLWGFNPKTEATIKEVVRAIHPEDRAAAAEVFNRALNKGEPYTIEMRMFTADTGDMRHILSTTEVQKNLSGGVTVIYGLDQDITDRKKAEAEREHIQAQLVQAQKMEAVGTLAGGIAHDFNNMLAGIIGSLNLIELLMGKSEPPPVSTLTKYVETAMESARRAADVTRQLLTLSRKSDMKRVAVDVSNALNNVLKIIRNSFPKSVQIEFSIPDRPIWIQGDPTQIEQVFLNLCVNASHAMTIMRPENTAQGGLLGVSVEEVKCDREFCILHPEASPHTAYARIQVSDTGEGIDREARQHIFDPFYTTKKKGEGTGLGLAVAYSIVRQHAGFIAIYSEPGTGSVFSVFLPLAEGTPSADDIVEKGDRLVRGAGNVLIIDDEKSVVRIARGMLEQCGYKTISADSGHEGIALFEKEYKKIDAVLLDLSMPDLSGMEVYEHLKKTDPGVRVLLASGLMESYDIRKASALGIRGFLQKPYTAEELSVKIKEILD